MPRRRQQPSRRKLQRKHRARECTWTQARLQGRGRLKQAHAAPRGGQPRLALRSAKAAKKGGLHPPCSRTRRAFRHPGKVECMCRHGARAGSQAEGRGQPPPGASIAAHAFQCT